ncbi:unnamed protein product [Lupinus luteus]|uniref:Potassium channel n=1 Tax=Lupinus luteus TaxID=3873 RepID=A0AAV1YFV7_LUPLU
MKAEYIPPREDVIMQSESPDDVYIIVPREVEIIDCVMNKEIILGTLHTGDMFGEVSALCCRPQRFTFTTKTVTQLLRFKTNTLIEAMQIKKEDNIQILKNLFQDAIASKHYSRFWILYHLASLSDPHITRDLLCTTTKRSDVTLMNELLKQGLNVDSKDQRGITPIQVAMEQNHVDMVRLLVMSSADVTAIPSEVVLRGHVKKIKKAFGENIMD